MTDERTASGLLGLDGLVTELAAATDDFAGLPEIATRAVGNLLQGTTVLWVLERDQRTIRLMAGWHPMAAARLDLAELGLGVELQYGEGFLGRLLEQRRSFFRPTMSEGELSAVNPAYREYFARHGLTGMIIVPMTARGQPIGMLGVSRHSGQEPFVEGDLAVVQQVAGHLALAVDNARLLAMARAEIRERERSELQLRHAATHDSLTGLPNRVLLRERLERLLPRPRSDRDAVPSAPDGEAGAGSSGGALLFLDLDGFKDVNDGLGHEAGDSVLRQMARRLASGIPDGGLLARLGGDEFAVLLDGTTAPAVEVAAALRALLEAPTWAAGQQVHLSGSIGVAYVRPRGERSADLMRRADLAMYRAKATREGVCVFDDVADGPAASRLTRLAALRRGIGRGELVVHFQPVVDLETGRASAAEALVRWDRGTASRSGELIAPDDFVPLAERSGLTPSLTREVVRLTAVAAAGWSSPLPLAVNLGAAAIVEPGMAEELAACFREHGVDPARVTLELEEEGLGDDRCRRALPSFAAAGFRLAVDDFGTGHASFASLSELALDEVKIDRSFVAGLAVAPGDEAIAASIAALGHRLGLDVVAEGVETPAALEALRGLGIRHAQGFLFAPPLPADEFARRWAAGATPPARRERAAARVPGAPDRA